MSVRPATAFDLSSSEPAQAVAAIDRPSRIAHQRVIRTFYGLMATVLTYTLIAQCILTHSEGRSLANTFSYFTIQSNVLVLITSAILAVKPGISGRLWQLVRLAALAGITVTGIVYAIFLAPYVHLHGMAAVYNAVFHYVMPWTTVLGFLVVEPRLRLRNRDFAFMAWPVAWLVFTMLRGALLHPDFTGFSTKPSHYPYEFLDVDHTPLIAVVGAIVLITAILVAVGAAYIHGDQRLEGGISAHRARQ